MNNEHLFKAAREASFAADYSGANAVKIGCVVAYRGTILAKGCNADRTHPTQERFNRFRYKDVGARYLPAKVHSEVAAVTKIKYLDIDFSKVHVFVYRELKDGRLANSKPCAACLAYIRSLGIRHIHWTEESGYCHLKIKE